MNVTAIVFACLLVILMVTASILLSFFSLWMKCRLSNTPVSFLQLLAMRLRGSPYKKLAEDYVSMKKNGIDITVEELELEYIKSPKNYQFFVDETMRQLQK